MYLYWHEVDDDVDFICIHIDIASFRVTIVCFWNGSIRESSGKVHYVRGRCRLFVCNSNMDLNQFKRFICSKIGLNPIRSTVNISFKYYMSGELLVFPVEDDDAAIDAMWEHSKSTQIPSLKLYGEEVPLGNVVASNPTPTLIPPPYDTEPELHLISCKNQGTANWTEINWSCWPKMRWSIFMAHLLHQTTCRGSSPSLADGWNHVASSQHHIMLLLRLRWPNL